MFLVDDLLFMPIDGIKFVFRTIMKTAEEQYLDDASQLGGVVVLSTAYQVRMA